MREIIVSDDRWFRCNDGRGRLCSSPSHFDFTSYIGEDIKSIDHALLGLCDPRLFPAHSHRRRWDFGLFQRRVDWMQLMESVDIVLFEGHESEVLRLPEGLNLRMIYFCPYINVWIPTPNMDLLLSREHSPLFLALKWYAFAWCMVAFERVVMQSKEWMIDNSDKIAAHSKLDPEDLVGFSPEITIYDEVCFGMGEIGLELVMP